jgi:hypothetical protein
MIVNNGRRFARERRCATVRTLWHILATPQSAREHLVFLRQLLHDSREAEAEVRDARRARKRLGPPPPKA